jgi:hypothetical protein
MARPPKSPNDVCVPVMISMPQQMKLQLQMYVHHLNGRPGAKTQTMSGLIQEMIANLLAGRAGALGTPAAPTVPTYGQAAPPPAYAPPPQSPPPAPQRPALPFAQPGFPTQLPPIEVYNDDGTLRQSINNGLPLTMSVEDYLELVDPVAAKAMRAKKAAEAAAADPNAPKKIEACSIEGVEAQMAGPTGQAARDREIENAKLRPQAEEMLKRRMEEIDRQNGIHRAPKSGIEK